MPKNHGIPNFRRVHLALLSVGVTPEPIYFELGITDHDINAETGSKVSTEVYLELLHRASIQRSDNFLGLRIGSLRTDLGHLGTLGYMLRNASSFERALGLIDSYVSLLQPQAVTGLVGDGDSCIWTYEITGASPDQSRHDTEMTMMEFVNLVRALRRDPEWRSETVYLRHQRPKDAAPLYQNLADEIFFQSRFNGVRFPRSLLFNRFGDADPQLLRLLEQSVQRSILGLHERDNLIGRIRLLISSRVGLSLTNCDEIAAELGISRRTFDRRLQALGTSFATIRDEVVLEVAKATLGETQLSVTELANELGYADASAFIRAFRRMTSLTPTQFRRMAGRHDGVD